MHNHDLVMYLNLQDLNFVMFETDELDFVMFETTELDLVMSCASELDFCYVWNY